MSRFGASNSEFGVNNETDRRTKKQNKSLRKSNTPFSQTEISQLNTFLKTKCQLKLKEVSTKKVKTAIVEPQENTFLDIGNQELPAKKNKTEIEPQNSTLIDVSREEVSTLKNKTEIEPEDNTFLNIVSTSKNKTEIEPQDKTLLDKGCSTCHFSTSASIDVITRIPEFLEIVNTDDAKEIIVKVTKQNESTLNTQEGCGTRKRDQEIDVDNHSITAASSNIVGEISKDCNIVGANRVEMNDDTDGHPGYIQDVLVDNNVSSEGLDYQVVEDNSNAYCHVYSLEESSDDDSDLSSKLKDKDKDPSWYDHTYDHKNMAETERNVGEILEIKKTSKTKKTLESKKRSVRHRRGPKPLPLENIDDEEKKKSIKRCREYRNKKSSDLLEKSSELDVLKARNAELKQQEQDIKEKIRNLKETYIQFINEGRIALSL